MSGIITVVGGYDPNKKTNNKSKKRLYRPMKEYVNKYNISLDAYFETVKSMDLKDKIDKLIEFSINMLGLNKESTGTLNKISYFIGKLIKYFNTSKQITFFINAEKTIKTTIHDGMANLFFNYRTMVTNTILLYISLSNDYALKTNKDHIISNVNDKYLDPEKNDILAILFPPHQEKKDISMIVPIVWEIYDEKYNDITNKLSDQLYNFEYKGFCPYAIPKRLFELIKFPLYEMVDICKLLIIDLLEYNKILKKTEKKNIKKNQASLIYLNGIKKFFDSVDIYKINAAMYTIKKKTYNLSNSKYIYRHVKKTIPPFSPKLNLKHKYHWLLNRINQIKIILNTYKFSVLDDRIEELIELINKVDTDIGLSTYVFDGH